MTTTTTAPITQESTFMPAGYLPVPNVEVSETSILVTLTVTADSTPIVAGPPGVPPPSTTLLSTTRPLRFSMAFQRPATGTIDWDISWTLNGEHYGTIASIPATGLTILRPKPVGPKLSVVG